MRRRVTLLPLVLLCFDIACDGGSTAATDAGASAAVSASASAPASASGSASSASDDLEPVYPRENVPNDPLADKFCNAVHGIIPTKQGECCSGKVKQRLGFAPECSRTLSYAMRHGAVTVDAAAVDQCVDETTKMYSGCDWIGPGLPPLPQVCHGLVKGTLQKGATCRSSLECADDMHCFGLGAIKAGRCGNPLPDGAPCMAAVDTLAAMTAQHRVHDVHPMCKGYCSKRCTAPQEVGAACKASLECGRGNHCAQGKCVAGGRPALGAPCPDKECEPGVRCIDGTCAMPKAGGEKCTSDGECRGACVKAEGAEEGLCGMRCPGSPNLERPPGSDGRHMLPVPGKPTAQPKPKAPKAKGP